MLYNLRTRKKINVGLESAEEPSEHIDLGLEAVELQQKKKKKRRGEISIKKRPRNGHRVSKGTLSSQSNFCFVLFFFFLGLTPSKAIKQSKTLPSSRKPIAKSKS
jgi:hypothetical protein